MSIKKHIITDQIEVTENNFIQVRTATRIIEDGVTLSESYHRHVLSPTDTLVGQDPKVVAVANAVWTEEVIEDYKASLLENDNLAS